MKFNNEDTQPFLFEGGDDGGEAAAPAENEAPAADADADKKESPADAEAPVVEDKLSDEAISKIKTKLCCNFWLWGILYGLLILIADIFRVKTEPCGIDVIFWCEIFFAILLAKTVLIFFAWFGISSCKPSSVAKYYLTVSIFMGALFFGWIVYGSVLYFSDDNDCQSNHEMTGWLVFMVIVIFVTYFLILLLLIFLCGFACLLCCIGKEKADSSKEFVDKYLTKQIYDPDQFNPDKAEDAEGAKASPVEG